MNSRSRATVGLCFDCRHSRIVDTPSSRFWLCELSFTDRRFPRYPRLPVVACDGYQPRNESGPPDAPEGPDS